MSLDMFIGEICAVVADRKKAGKYDAYFDIPKDMSYEQIKMVINELKEKHQIISRLYAARRIQAFWDYSPRRNPYEFLLSIGAIMNPDKSMELFSQDLNFGYQHPIL